MLGNECPECGVRLVNNRCAECGWIMVAAPLPNDGCSACHGARVAGKHPPEWVSAQHCQRCGDHSPNTTYFHDDGAPEDRGRRLCPGCWIPALRRRAERDPISAEERTRLRQELAVATDRMEARVLSRSLKHRAPASPSASEVPIS